MYLGGHDRNLNTTALETLRLTIQRSIPNGEHTVHQYGRVWSKAAQLLIQNTASPSTYYTSSGDLQPELRISPELNGFSTNIAITTISLSNFAI